MRRGKGSNPELQRIDISHLTQEQRQVMRDGIRYLYLNNRRSDAPNDKHYKQVTNTLFALNTNRSWLTKAQYRIAEFHAEEWTKAMKRYEAAGTKKGK